MPRSPLPRRRSRLAAGALALGAVLVLLTAVGARAQTSTTGPASTPDTGLAVGGGTQPFPVSLVGPIPAAEVPVERAMTDLYLAPSMDPERPQFVVQFRSPFPLPKRPYRVSVVVGQPDGPRLRSSLFTDGNGTTTWKADTSSTPWPGNPWTEVGANADDASFSPSGLVTITVPITSAPEGQAVWAEVEAGTDGKQYSISPYFSRSAMFGFTEPGVLPSSIVGSVLQNDGTPTGRSTALPPGPTVAIKDGHVEVTTTERPPAELLGQKVTSAYDFLRIADTFNTRAVVTNYVWIDRTTGSVRLIDGFAVPPVDNSGDKATWLTAGLPQDPGAPGTLRLDLHGLARATGKTLRPDASGLGVRREYLLADGRRVVAEAVMGTVAWYDPGALDVEPTAIPVAPLGPVATAEEGNGVALTKLLLVVVGLVAVGMAIVALLTRRRHRVPKGDAADLLDDLAVETARHRAIRRQEAEEAEEAAMDEEALAVATARPPADADQTGPLPFPIAPPELADEADADAGVQADDDDDGVDLDGDDGRSEPIWADDREPALVGARSPDDALAELGADLDALTARLHRASDT